MQTLQPDLHGIFDYIDEKIGSKKFAGSQEIEFFSEFCRENGVNRDPCDVINEVHKVLESNWQQMDNRFSMWSKVKWLYVLGIPVEKDFAESLKREAILKLNPQDHIISISSNDGIHAFGPAGYNYKQMAIRKLADFVAEFSKNPKNVQKKKTTHLRIVHDFKKRFPEQRTISSVLSKRLTEMKTQIHLFTWFDVPTRVRMLYVLDVPVTAEFLEIIRKNAAVIVSASNKITAYQAHNGSLKLGGEVPESEDFIILDGPAAPLLRNVKQEPPGLPQMTSTPSESDDLIYDGSVPIPVKQEELDDDYWMQNRWAEPIKEEEPDEPMDYIDGSDPTSSEIPENSTSSKVNSSILMSPDAPSTILEPSDANSPSTSSRIPPIFNSTSSEALTLHEQILKPSEAKSSISKASPRIQKTSGAPATKKPISPPSAGILEIAGANSTSSEPSTLPTSPPPILQISAANSTSIDPSGFTTPSDTSSVIPAASRENSTASGGTSSSPTSSDAPTVNSTLPTSSPPILEISEANSTSIEPSAFTTSSETSLINLSTSGANSTSSGGTSSSPTSSEAPTTSATSPEEFIDLKKYLDILACLIFTLDSPQLTGIQEKLQMRKNVENSRKIPLKKVIFSLDLILQLVISNSNSEDVTGIQKTSISTHKILGVLMTFIFGLNAPEMTLDLKTRIKKVEDDSGFSGKSVPIESLQSALETTLLLIGQ